jgi:hypothetical protein
MNSRSEGHGLQRACRQVLRPIARLLLKAGWTWKEFADVSKGVFVAVASEEFGKRGRPANASRVAILTGLNRRDVSRLRRVDAPDEAAPAPYMSPGSRVLSGWHQDADFLDSHGRPRALAIDGGSAPGFGELVRRYAADIPVVAMLKELQAAGAVALDDSRHVHALQRSYVPRTTDANQVRLWGTVLQDVGTTLEHNLMRSPDQPPRFERAAISVEVEARQLPAFRAFLEREGQAFLERVDDWLTAHGAGSGAERRTLRLGAGVYHIEDHAAARRRAGDTSADSNKEA